MKKLFSLFAIACSLTLAAEEAGISMSEQRYRRTGGEIVKRGTYQGNILIANTQSRLPTSEVRGVCEEIRKALNVRITCIETAELNPSLLAKNHNANVVLLVIDNPSQPALLVAPEDRWATVNTANLVNDLPGEKAKKKFFTPRARKEIIKGFSILCGGGSSQFPGNIMNAATIRELDMVKEQIPVDMIDFWIRYLSRIGVTQPEFTTYRRACKEGWAPAPTNDVQKAIWDKVHAAPKAPMKIEFDPKKGR